MWGCGQHAGDKRSLSSFLIFLWMPLENLFWEEEATVCLVLRKGRELELSAS